MAKIVSWVFSGPFAFGFIYFYVALAIFGFKERLIYLHSGSPMKICDELKESVRLASQKLTFSKA